MGAKAVHVMKASPADAATVRFCLIFECRFAQDLFCAVPMSCPVPELLIGSAWVFRGTLGKRGFKLPGFKPASTLAAVRRDGFYFFMSPDRCSQAADGSRTCQAGNR